MKPSKLHEALLARICEPVPRTYGCVRSGQVADRCPGWPTSSSLRLPLGDGGVSDDLGVQHELKVPVLPISGSVPERFREQIPICQEFSCRFGSSIGQAGDHDHGLAAAGVDEARNQGVVLVGLPIGAEVVKRPF